MTKPQFKPIITRVKLNPEQAVLQCSCYDIGTISGSTGLKETTVCRVGSKTHRSVVGFQNSTPFS